MVHVPLVYQAISIVKNNAIKSSNFAFYWLLVVRQNFWRYEDQKSLRTTDVEEAIQGCKAYREKEKKEFAAFFWSVVLVDERVRGRRKKGGPTCL